MPGLRSLVFFFVVACWFLAMINAAAVRTLVFDNESANVKDNDGRESERYIVFPESFRTRRSIESSPESCSGEIPCAWMVYNPVTRENIGFLKNIWCNCTASLQCVKTNDDPENSMWVYKCRTNVSGTTLTVG